MIPDVPVPALLLIVLVLLCLFVAVKSFAMPKSFFKKQEKKEELRERFLPEKTPPPA